MTTKNRTRRSRKIGKHDIKRIIPYKEPFLFLDRIKSVGRNELIAEKKLTRSSDFFKGHFVGFPLMPGMLTLEALGQAATFLVRCNIKDHLKKDILLYHITSADFFAPLFPDDNIIIKVRIAKKSSKIFDCCGEVLNKNRVVCKARASLIVVERDEFRMRTLKKAR